MKTLSLYTYLILQRYYNALICKLQVLFISFLNASHRSRAIADLGITKIAIITKNNPKILLHVIFFIILITFQYIFNFFIYIGC